MDRPPATYAVTTADGVRAVFDHYADGSGRSVLVLCHGFFQSRSAVAFRAMARAFATDRDVICMDMRGHGASSGAFTFSAREHAEVEAVVDWARERYRQIHVMGFSLGGAAAIQAVSRCREGVAGLIAVSAPAAFEDIEFKFWTPEAIRTGVRGLGRGTGCRPGNPFLAKTRPVDAIAGLAGLPVLLIHGTRDVIVGVEHSRRLFAAARDPKRLELVEGGSHAEALFRDDPDQFMAIIRPWLDSP